MWQRLWLVAVAQLSLGNSSWRGISWLAALIVVAKHGCGQPNMQWPCND